MNEEWRDIPGYEGRYQVSNYGHVRSLPYKRTQLSSHGTVMEKKYPGKMIIPTDNGNGYKYIRLVNGEKKKNCYIHRLVAEMFIPNPDGKKEVNHIDFNKSNNSYLNLEWVSRKENIHHSIQNMMVHRNLKLPESTGERYIRFKDGRYQFSYKRKIKGPIYKSFSTLEEAINYRGVVLNGE